MERTRLHTGVAAAAVIAALLAAAPAAAQVVARSTNLEPAPTETQTTAQTPTQFGQGPADAATVEEVVVTGSLVRGAAEQAALPVQVIGAEDLLKQGSPSTVEFVKQLTSTGGVIGDANGFAAGRTEGAASINLRDLGSNRTLVLFNGRRQVESGSGAFIDLNMFPPAAIGRVEILKDGAAATYGSDAIGGVVNFITRKGLRGFDVGGDYSAIDGSAGDYTVRAAYGFEAGRFDGFLALGHQRRSQLQTTERDFTTPKFQSQDQAKAAYLYNPQGGWSAAANPGTYIGGAAFNQNFLDPGCPVLGELQISATQCLFRYIDQYNLVEDQNLFQLYGELNYKITDKIKAHVEVLAGHTEVFGISQTASYGPNQYPTSVTSPVANQFFIPATNPGLATLIALNPSVAPFANNALRGVLAHPFFQRPLGTGGNPLYDFGAQENKRFMNQYRVSGDINGEFEAPVLGTIGWDVAVTYGRSDYDSTNPDFLVNRLELAYRGFGSRFDGPECDFRTGTPGTGSCFYFNPFSTGVASNPSTGQVNPQYAQAVALDPRVVNDPEVIRWIYGADPQRVFTDKSLLVVDGLVNGHLPFKLWGDNFLFAVGYQFRDAAQSTRYSAFTNNALFPCIDSITTGTQTCTTRNGPYTFYGNYNVVNVGQQTHAVFGELDVPVTPDLQLQFAVRHEDSQGGQTTNPKVAARWQALPWLAIRGSAGTAFRAAPIAALQPNAVTALTFISQISSYRPFDNFGNPNLRAETADTYNLGFIVNTGGFSGSIDYFRFEFQNPIGGESGVNILNAIFPTGQPNRCNDPTYAALISRVTFNASGCGAANIVRARTQTINGAAVKTDGLDGSVEYRWLDAPFGGRVTVGGDITYTLNFKVGPTIVEGITTIPAYNAVGKLNYSVAYSSLPRWKGAFFAEYNRESQNFRATVRYIDGMRDQRDNIFASTNNGQGVTLKGQRIKEFVTVDFVYRVQLPYDTAVTASIVNAFDKDPPFARLDYSYDPFTANPLGRVFKIGASKRF